MTKDQQTPPNIFRQELGLPDSKPVLFTPPVGQTVIPEAKYNSLTGSLALKSLDPKIQADASRPALDGITAMDAAAKQNQLNIAIKSSLEKDDGIPIENKVRVAKAVLQVGVTPNTVGQAYKDNVYPDQPDSQIDKAMDNNIVQDDAKANILTNMGHDSTKDNYDNIMAREHPGFLNILSGAFNLPLPGVGAVATANPQVGEALGVLAEAGANSVVKFLGEKIANKQNASLKDVISYLSFVPVHPEAEIDTQNAVKIVFSKDTMPKRLERLQQWNTEFKGKYGEDGYYQMAAFFAKEGVVDAAALALALKSPATAEMLLPKVKGGAIASGIFTRLTKALGRASVMGLGGQGVQSSMDSYLGMPTSTGSFVEGTVARTAGAFVGEGIASALTVLGKGIIGTGHSLISGGTKLVGQTGEPISAVSPEVLVSSVQTLNPALKEIHGVSVTAPSVGDSLSDMVGTTANTAPIRDVASQLKAAMQEDKVGSLGHIFDMTESEINAASLSRTPSLKENVLLHGVGNRIIGEKITRQSNVDKTLEYYFNDGLKTVAMRDTKYQGDTSLFKAKDWVFEPRNTIGGQADNLYDINSSVKATQKALIEAQKVAFKGLKEPVQNKILNIRTKHSNQASEDPAFRVTQASLEAEGLTPNEQDAYWAVGKYMDFAALLTEHSALQRIAQTNIKQLHGSRQVEVLKSMKGEDAGSVMVRDIKGGEPFAVRNSDLSEVTQVLGYRRYHVPRRADNADYLLGTMDIKTGKLEVHTASQYQSDIAEHAAKLDADYKGTGKVAFYWRTNSGEGSMNFGMGQNSASALDVLDDAAMKSLKEALKKTGRTDISDADLASVRLGFDNVTFGSITSQKVAGKRGLEGLKTVTGEAYSYKPDNAAITDYLMDVSAIQYRDFRLDSVAKFKKEFAEVLADPTGDWDQPIINVLGKSELAQRASSVQNYIRRSIFNETSYGKTYRNGIDAFADSLRAKGGTAKAMVDGIEKMPIISGMFKQTRDGTVFLRKADSLIVFAGNLGSFVTQLAPSVAMIVGSKAITNPTHLIKGWGNLLGALAIKAGAGKAMPKEVHAALQALRKSGIVSDVSLDDMAYRAYGQASSLYSKAMYFVQKGEELNKSNIWMVVREDMKALAEKGELQGITRMLGKTDIDSPEFIQKVSEKAKQLHLDLSPAGRLGVTSGLGATLFQWSSPIIKTHTMFFAKGLSGAEKFGAALGLFSMYGLAAVPFVGTGLSLMDKVGETFTGGDEFDEAQMATDMTNNVAKHLVDEVGDLAGFTPEQKKFYVNTVKKGLVSTLTDNDVSLYQKMTLTLFTNSIMSNSVQDPMDSIPLVSVMRKAANSSANIYEMLDNLYGAYTLTPEEAAQEGIALPSAQQKKIELRKFLGEVLDEVGNAVPGVGRIADVLNNNPETRRYLKPQLDNAPETGFVTRSGKRIETGELVSSQQRLLLAFGIAPAPVQANREVLKGQYDRVAILGKMKTDWINKYKNANTDIAKVRTMREAFVAATDAEQILMSTYQGALSIATGSSDNKPYRAGTLRKQWFKAMINVDNERMSGNFTTSKGE